MVWRWTEWGISFNCYGSSAVGKTRYISQALRYGKERRVRRSTQAMDLYDWISLICTPVLTSTPHRRWVDQTRSDNVLNKLHNIPPWIQVIDHFSCREISAEAQVRGTQIDYSDFQLNGCFPPLALTTLGPSLSSMVSTEPWTGSDN